jgi:ASC-1-like (ASCH) protein
LDYSRASAGQRVLRFEDFLVDLVLRVNRSIFCGLEGRLHTGRLCTASAIRTHRWPGDVDSYVDALVWLVGRMIADPKHFYRSCTTQELNRIMTSRPATTTGVRAREMNLYRRYFDLVAAGRKTIEVRVQYPNLRRLKAGDHIRFVCGRDDALTRVTRVAKYDSFEKMLDSEGPANVNPESPREQQLANIRRIYGPEKEALGVLAIEIELLAPSTDR